MGGLWETVMAWFGRRRVRQQGDGRRRKGRAASAPVRKASGRASPRKAPGAIGTKPAPGGRRPSGPLASAANDPGRDPGTSAGPPPRVPGEAELPPARAALIREALLTHRAKRRALDSLDGDARSLLEALAFETLFFPSARPLPPENETPPGRGGDRPEGGRG